MGRVDFSPEKFSCSRRLLTETRMEKLKHVVSEKSDFRHSAKAKHSALFGMQASNNEVLQQVQFRSCPYTFGFKTIRIVKKNETKNQKQFHFFINVITSSKNFKNTFRFLRKSGVVNTVFYVCVPG